MKMKYTAIVALIAWLAVTGWLATMVIAKPAVLHLGNQAEETAAMAELRNAIARNAKAQELIAPLRHSAMVGIGTQLIAVAAPGGQPVSGAGTAAGNALQGEHAVSLVMIADGRRTAVIDGQRARAGMRLADGSLIQAIGPDWVRIIGLDGVPTVHQVRSPFQQHDQAGRTAQ